jgi:hypothetical protein
MHQIKNIWNETVELNAIFILCRLQIFQDESFL